MRVQKSYLIIFCLQLLSVGLLILFLILRPSVWHIVALVAISIMQIISLINMLLHAKLNSVAEDKEDEEYCCKKEKKHFYILWVANSISAVIMLTAFFLFIFN